MAEEKHGKTLFVRNLPYSTTNESLEKVFSDIGPIKSCFVVKDKESGKCRGFGYVKFTLLEDAEKALKTIKKLEDRPVHIVYANKKEKKKKFGLPQAEKDTGTVPEAIQKKSQKETKVKLQKKTKNVIKGQKQAPNPLNEGKRARLIIRNLAFQCTKEGLKNAFKAYGDVVDVHIPKKESGTKLGFGFVQFSNKAQAGMAVKELNGKEICGRVVAVDWALPKDKFESKLAANSNEETPATNEESMDVFEEENVEIAHDTSSSSSEEEEEEEKEEEVESTDDEDDDSESSEDKEHNNEGEDDKTEGVDKKSPDRESDVAEGKTVFIRNLPYSVTNEDLEEYFSQFGNVKYARVVIDKNSGLPKGTAFVQFQTKESATSCIDASSGEHEVSIGGRQLLVTLAVSRHQADDLTQKKDKKKEQKDSRNLFLVREGMIRPGTEAAKDVPPADLAKRAKIDAAKRKKLKDQNIFISSTRLCVHNIPPTVSDKTLRGILIKAAGDKQAKLVECRIMRDLNRVNSQGVGKSRGYAFCAFTEHEHALNALRCLNNNPETFGDKRPIVEFSLESRKALEAKQKRLEKSRAKLKQQIKDGQNSKGDKNSVQLKKKRKTSSKQVVDGNYKAVKYEQDKIARDLRKGPLGLPSHSGPKQRHKPRPAQDKPGDKRNKYPNQNKRQSVNQHQPVKTKKDKFLKPQNTNKRKQDFDNFDRLVAAYKKKIMSSAIL